MAANRKILIAMSMLLVAIFASISVTFAWFSTSMQATAMFTLTTRESDDYLRIRIDEGGISDERVDSYEDTKVKFKDLSYVNRNNVWKLVDEDGNLAPKNSYVLQQYTLYTNNPTKSVYFGGKQSKVTSAYTAAGFIGASPMAKTYWYREGQTNEKIAQFYGTTDVTKTSDTSNSIVWREGEPDETIYYFNQNGRYETSAANAMRVMMYPSAVSSIPAAKAQLVWEPNADEGYDVKDENGNYVYEQVSSYHRNAFLLQQDPVDRSAASNKTDYDTVTSEDKIALPYTAWQEVPETDPEYASLYAALDDRKPYTAQLTVVMWLEGRDADCFNILFGKTVEANFVFALA